MKRLKIIIGLIFIIAIATSIYYQFIFTYMPKYLDFKKFQDRTIFAEEEIVYKNENTNEQIIIIPIHGPMSFSSGNNIIGLYKDKKLVDEIKIGAIPIRLKKWTKEKITFRIIANRDQSYLDTWLKNIDFLGEYECIFTY